MGCLTARINVVNTEIQCDAFSQESVKAIHANCINSLVGLNAKEQNTDITLKISDISKVNVNGIPENKAVNTNFKGIRTNINLRVALVCHVGKGSYEYFYVTQGPLMVQEGYLMVERN